MGKRRNSSKGVKGPETRSLTGEETMWLYSSLKEKSWAEVKRCKGVIFGPFEGRGAGLRGAAEQV